MRTIKAKFNSRCAETGAMIARGTDCIYDPVSRKVYVFTSDVGRAFIANQRPKDWVQDPGELAEDQWNQSQRY